MDANLLLRILLLHCILKALSYFYKDTKRRGYDFKNVKTWR